MRNYVSNLRDRANIVKIRAFRAVGCARKLRCAASLARLNSIARKARRQRNFARVTLEFNRFYIFNIYYTYYNL